MKNAMNQFWKSKGGEAVRSFFSEHLFIRFMAAWFIVSSINICNIHTGFDVLTFVNSVKVVDFILMTLCVMLTIHFLSEAFKFPIDYYVLLFSAFIYCCIMAAKNHNFYFSLGILLALSFIGYYILHDDKLKLTKVKLTNKVAVGIVGAAALFFIVYVGGLTTLRYLNYTTSTYDFGIFSQMFYYMKETLLPNTTCERSQLLSHFAVHLSPIFYVLLPGYFIFSSPAYLQIMQAVVLGSAVIPLFLLARHFSLSNKVTVCICIAYCFYPALAGGCFYDIHENMFLTPLILWLLYFMEKQKWPLMYLFALLTCMVKEDAIIYVASIALFMIFSRKERKNGLPLLIGSIAYFAAAAILLKNMGQGVMSGRFDNLISDQNQGLLSIFKTVFLNPGYILSQIFNQDKLSYIVLMLLPIVFLPLVNRKLSQLLLAVPFLVINLMPNYPYQHSITFQYNFGTIALFFYLVVLNVSDFRGRIKKYAVPFMAAASVLLFISNVSNYTDNIGKYLKNKAQYQQLNTYLETIPENASVQATGYFIPKLSKHKLLYDIRYNDSQATPAETEYIALDLRPNSEKDVNTFLTKYEGEGYQPVVYQEDLIAILKK